MKINPNLNKYLSIYFEKKSFEDPTNRQIASDIIAHMDFTDEEKQQQSLIDLVAAILFAPSKSSKHQGLYATQIQFSDYHKQQIAQKINFETIPIDNLLKGNLFESITKFRKDNHEKFAQILSQIPWPELQKGTKRKSLDTRDTPSRNTRSKVDLDAPSKNTRLQTSSSPLLAWGLNTPIRTPRKPDSKLNEDLVAFNLFASPSKTH